MVKIKPLHNYVKTPEEYNAFFDELVKTETDWWENQPLQSVANPTEEELKEIKNVIVESDNRDFSDKEVEEAHRSFYLGASVFYPMAIKDFFETKREDMVIKWQKRDQEKEKRVFDASPLENIKCSKCGSEMEYKWSDLYDSGTAKKPVEQVMFFYECPNQCERKIFFENGDPWIIESANNCAICGGKRKSTITQDKENKKFIIYECEKCGAKEVETV